MSLTVRWHPKVHWPLLLDIAPQSDGIYVIGYQTELDYIQDYKNRGEFYATWVRIREQYLDGVERYLAIRLKPLVGKQWGSDDPIIQVNRPERWI